MPHICQLSPHIANLIAAGEVVERPASVVKELLENAIDAGAHAVTVEIQNGGMTYLRVSDDGCGIAPDELSTAFLRHATSKLRTADDLAAIGTLGFRGEALAAIASVSRVDIFSRARGAALGASLHLEGGVPEEVNEAGCPEGTSIIVRDLFFNTPARLKFMKQDRAESTAIAGLVGHLALSHPDISFRLLKDGSEVLHTSGDGVLKSAVYSALGREFALSLLPVKANDGTRCADGFVTHPLSGRGTRGMQTFFVNGRLVKSQLLTAALEEAYANRQMKGKFPGCVLDVTLPNDQVDVNVHPAKTVVKFLNERAVFNVVYHGVCDALDAADAPQSAPKPASAQQNPRADFYQTMAASDYRAQVSTAPTAKSAPTLGIRVGGMGGEREGIVLRDSMPRGVGGALGVPLAPRGRVSGGEAADPIVDCGGIKPEAPIPPRVSEPIPTPAPISAPIPAPAPQKGDELDEQTTFLPSVARPWRIVGEVLDTYIICEDDEKTVWLIDKHAAHERVNFDRLRARQEPIMSQPLLVPVSLAMGAEEWAALSEHEALLREFGFECEEFGEGRVLIRAVPDEIAADNAASALEELAGRLVKNPAGGAEGARDALLHTMACKAAIKGGWKSGENELRVLVDKVQRGEVKFCPHGRPVAVKLTKYELERMFKRA